jgi:hypothetical protein
LTFLTDPRVPPAQRVQRIVPETRTFSFSCAAARRPNAATTKNRRGAPWWSGKGFCGTIAREGAIMIAFACPLLKTARTSAYLLLAMAI